MHKILEMYSFSKAYQWQQCYYTALYSIAVEPSKNTMLKTRNPMLVSFLNNQTIKQFIVNIHFMQFLKCAETKLFFRIGRCEYC